ncbi:glycosyltransferase [Limimaricola sp. AA108-03]|uniref:glycosyltransferase n=1 Tax=Limimaricola sp. AA108-03 TaxID=3425945 RepID=UPI003D77CF9D
MLCYDSLDDTRQLVSTLRASTSRDVDIYVVDNDSPGLGVAELSTALPDVTVLRAKENLGYAAGNNIGLSRIAAQGHEFVWILNPDMEADAAALDRLLSAAEQFPHIDVFGPVIFRGTNRDRIATAGSFVSLQDGFATGHLLAGRTASDLPTAPYEVDCLTGAALFIRCSALPRLGPIPEHYFLYFEETHWLIAGRRKGVRCMVLPDLHLVHHKASGAGGIPARHFLYYYVRNFLLFANWMGVQNPYPSLSRLRHGFVADALNKVAERAPLELPLYEYIAEQALQDGLAGREGKVALPGLSL